MAQDLRDVTAKIRAIELFNPRLSPFPPRALGSLLCHGTLVRSVPLYLPPPAGSIIPVHTVDGAP